MTAVYLAAVIIGAPFVAFYVFAGFDAYADGDTGLGASDFLSFRSVAFLVAFFGVSGMLLTGLGVDSAVTPVAAVVVGLFAMWLNAKLVSLVRGGEPGELTVDMIEGRPAQVVAPIPAGGRGRVALEAGGQQVFLVAVSSRGVGFAVGDHVVVVRLDRGAAYVEALD